MCELCCSKDIIFPWDLLKIFRCEKCGACFHLDCKRNSDCSRCARLRARQVSIEEQF